MMIRRGAVGDMLDGGRRKRSRAYAGVLVWAFCVLCAWLTPALAGERGAVGDLYVCNDLGDNILQYDGETAEYVGQFVTTGSGGLDGLFDMAWGPNGNLFVANTDDYGSRGFGNILEFDGKTGEFIRVFAKGTRRRMQLPITLAFGGPGSDLYVICDDVDGVFVFDGVTGEFEQVLFRPMSEHGLLNPGSLKFGPNGNIFITDRTSFHPTLYEFDANTGSFVRIVITAVGKSKTGFIYEPKRDTWLTAGSGANSVERFDNQTGESLGVVVRGVPNTFYSLQQPNDLAWGPNGNLFVCGGKTLIPLPSFPDGRRTGALHEYDGETYEVIQVFGYMTEFGDAEHKVWYPNGIEFKPLPGDCGGDQGGGDWDVDLWDVSRFFNAFTGRGVRSHNAQALIAFDADHDGDIDLEDYEGFHGNITGPK